MTARKQPTGKLDFEKSLKQLERIVQRLEDEQVPLEEALRLFEEGRKLAQACERELAAAENRVRLLTGQGESALGAGSDATGKDEAPDAEPDDDAPELGPGEEEFPF